MKKNLLIFSLLISTVAFSQTTITYPGNGNDQFGGAVGKGTISITETTDSVSFSLTRGTGLFDSLIVFYLDAQAGGISSTAGLNGSSDDPYHAAVAGYNPATGRAVLNFPDDFQPDAAIAFDKDGGKVFYFFGPFVVAGSAFTITPSGTNSATTYTQRSKKADLGVTGTLNFKFVGNYIGKSASRSNEAFGDPFSNYSRNSNTLSYNPYTITSYFSFPTALPVKLVDFKAAKQGSIVNVNWLVADEASIEKYELQRSIDGVNFSTIATVNARNSSVSSSYNAKDALPKNGMNYYRLIIIERGKSDFSKVISLNVAGAKKGFVANLITHRTLNLNLNEISAGTYKFSVLNSNGQLVQAQNVVVDGAYQNKQIQLNKNLAQGIYRVAIQSKTDQYTSNILVQ